MTSTYSTLFPPCPQFTETSLGDLSGNVCIITGATSGMGFELAKILYSAGATVYIGARSESKISSTISNIRQAIPKSHGNLKGFCLDFGDLSAVKPAVAKFLEGEKRLDKLIHNAGVMMPPVGSVTKQGHDLELGINCLGPYLLSHLLEPILTTTAAQQPKYSVRVIIVTTSVHLSTTPKEGISFNESGSPEILKKPFDNYMQSKFGGQFLAKDIGTRLDAKGIMSLGVHPGIFKTELQRNDSPIPLFAFKILFRKPPVYGAYSQLFAAFSPDIKAEDNGGYCLPFGRMDPLPPLVEKGLKSRKEGGTGVSKKFLDYCEGVTSQYR